MSADPTASPAMEGPSTSPIPVLARPDAAPSGLDYQRPDLISIKDHPVFDERWVQQLIANDPSLLGLGSDLDLKDKERIQPRAGRLDLLLQDASSKHRYEVEIQLGKTDESHIIRTIEYWDFERRRYPQYDHTAVIVAEDITSRFLNVVGLFNGVIPIVAIQMRAYKIANSVSLIFTTVLDETRLGPVDDDEMVREVTDRPYWEKRAPKATLAMADDLLGVIHEWAPDLALNYTKFYIGLQRNGRPNTFVTFWPRKGSLLLEARLDRSEEVQNKLEEAGLDLMDYSRWGTYRVKVAQSDLARHADLIRDILKRAYDEASAG